jgi:hypothetical protein
LFIEVNLKKRTGRSEVVCFVIYSINKYGVAEVQQHTLLASSLGCGVAEVQQHTFFASSLGCGVAEVQQHTFFASSSGCGIAEVQQHTFFASSLGYLEVLASLFGLFALRNIPRYALSRWVCGTQTRAGPLALAGI